MVTATTEMKKEPWEISASQYQLEKGVHQPWIAEIAPSQYARLSKRGKAEYDKKRASEWQASADVKQEWRDKVMEAYDKGTITKETSGLHPDAKAAIIRMEATRKERTESEQFDKAYKENRIRNISELKVGDRVYDLMTRTYGKVEKLYKNSARVKWGTSIRGKDTWAVNVRQLQWLSYDDLKAQVGKREVKAGKPEPTIVKDYTKLRDWELDILVKKDHEKAIEEKARREKPPPAVEKVIRLTVRPKTYRGEAGFTVKGEDTDIFFSKESQAREYVRRIKAGEKPDKVLSDIWRIKQVRSGYTITELMRIHAKRSPLSQASDERQSHQVTIGADNPKARAWAKDPGTADIEGIDTPPIGSRSPNISSRTPRITPKVGRLK